MQGAEAIPTAGFSGIRLDKDSNANLRWNMYTYAAKDQNPVISSASTAVAYDVMIYWSNMFTITELGDLVIAGKQASV